MKRNNINVYLALPEYAYQRITQLAKENGRSRCAYIRQIIRKYLVYLDRADQPDAPPMDWRVE